MTRFDVIDGGGEPVDIAPAPTLTLAKPLPWGEHKVCCACAFRWHQRRPANGCPNCKAGMHWLEDHWTPERADARAREIDPEQVRLDRARYARELAGSAA